MKEEGLKDEILYLKESNRTDTCKPLSLQVLHCKVIDEQKNNLFKLEKLLISITSFATPILQINLLNSDLLFNALSMPKYNGKIGSLKNTIIK